MQKTTDLEATVKPNGISDGEQELDNQALTQILRTGIVVKVLLPSFGTISLVKAQLK
jgi:hypothetical protein